MNIIKRKGDKDMIYVVEAANCFSEGYCECSHGCGVNW